MGVSLEVTELSASVKQSSPWARVGGESALGHICPG